MPKEEQSSKHKDLINSSSCADKYIESRFKTLFRSGFPKLFKLFFQMAPFKEIKKAIAPSNKTTQKITI